MHRHTHSRPVSVSPRSRPARTVAPRRAFLVATLAAGLSVAALPFLPWGASKPDAKQLLDPAIAKANPQVLRQLCLLYYQHPTVEIRRACASYSGAFDDPAMRSAHWAMTADTDLQVRTSAVRSILMRDDSTEVSKVVSLYRADASLRPVIDEFVGALGMTDLEKALRAP